MILLTNRTNFCMLATVLTLLTLLSVLAMYRPEKRNNTKLSQLHHTKGIKMTLQNFYFTHARTTTLFRDHDQKERGHYKDQLL